MSARRITALSSVLIALVVSIFATEGSPAFANDKTTSLSRDSIIRIVVQIQRADYEGNRAALKTLYSELAPIPEDRKLASRVLYWRGFALWRRAFNGFNDAADPADLGQDLQQAVKEFDDASAKDPGVAVDAKVGAGSCLSNLMFLNRKDPARIQELVRPTGHAHIQTSGSAGAGQSSSPLGARPESLVRSAGAWRRSGQSDSYLSKRSRVHTRTQRGHERPARANVGRARTADESRLVEFEPDPRPI